MGESTHPGRGFQPDSDVRITLKDQEQINHFAKCYAKHADLISDLKAKEVRFKAKVSELENLQYAIEELVLMDENEVVPFLEGEVFLCLSLKDVNKALEREKGKLMNDIKELEDFNRELKSVLANLKIQLYDKFGSHINLED